MRRALSAGVATFFVLMLSMWFVQPAQAVSTTRVSVSTAGAEGNGHSGGEGPDVSVSADGRFVAFSSLATNLVGGDDNGASDVFVRDRQTSQTTRVSKATDGTQADSDSYITAISGDGRFVAFQSYATNLVGGDTNDLSDVFVRDRQTGQTTRVSKASDGAQGAGFSGNPSISADGRFVAFTSEAPNLVGGDTNDSSDVFVRDRQTGQTTRVSKTSDGTQGDNHSVIPSISADGRFVAFFSYATNLVGGDTNGSSDVFVRDRQTGQTTRVSKATNGIEANGSSYAPAISADGRFVAFQSDAPNLVGADANNVSDVFVRDRQTGQTTRVSKATDGTEGNDFSYAAAISADGRFVAFQSYASTLVGGDTNDLSDIFVRDRLAGQTTRVSKATDGTQTDSASYAPAISADGRFVVFPSFATNLVAGDENGVQDVFVRDRQ